MNKDNAIENYLKKVPEIQEQFLLRCKDSLIDNTDGAYVVWSLGLVPCIIENMKKYESNKDMLIRTFEFFEEMATSDEEVRELLLYSVLEKLGDDKDILNTSMSLMGENTLKYSKQVENFFGRLIF